MKGIKNIGNTCYINSILQVLSYNSYFMEFLDKYKQNIEHYIKDIETNNKSTELFFELYKIIKELNMNNGVISIIPYSFLKILESKWGNNICNQHDSLDVYQFILDNIITFVGKDYEYTQIEHNNQTLNKLIKLSAENKKLYFKNQFSEMNEIFYGQQLSFILCEECEHIEYNFEIFNSINLDIQNIKDNINECLDNYFNWDRLEDYKCSKCNKCKVKKKNVLWELPKTLTIVFKKYNSALHKIEKKINYSHELNLEKYLFNYPNIIINNFNYNLYSIINHYGNFSSGHYISIVNNNNIWNIINDDDISNINKDDINNVNNYILFYNLVN